MLKLDFYRVTKFIHICLLMQLLALGSAVQSKAQAQTASEESLLFAKTLSRSCLKQWDQPQCLTNISQAVLVLAANYAGDLESKGMVGAVEQIKNNCAAATAGTKSNYPAYAMKSAFTECANMISDVSTQTKIKPDLSQYQLLISSIMCLNKDRSCAAIEQGLKAYK